ncbi:MAG TPA: undecaprenyldiphospho-muramoylpentapeptide beta-N-acetylglucosaminyltransferase [Candidatus Brocadiia bacterium]|nr:undecaprenyldiphospho-muramoylpentapeptide beta-N-acetylglucosaminyltransferase [Candidatus Brocadiia bacterium]
MRLALAGGATGGHLLPGVAVAQAVREFVPDVEVKWLATYRASENYCLGVNGIEVYRLPAPRLRKGVIGLPIFASGQCACYAMALSLFAARRPSVVIGLGGYASAAPVMAAKSLGIPVMLLEQNAIAGRATRTLSRFAHAACVPWEECRGDFSDRCQVEVTGNPVRMNCVGRNRALAASTFGLDPQVKTLLVVGGSQGSVPINSLLASGLDKVASKVRNFQIIHCAGPGNSELVREAYERNGIRATVVDFLEDMGAAYAATDLVVCRAGGTTIAEIAANGLPGIFIPYPYAVDNHQYHNALAHCKPGSGVILEERGLSPSRLWNAALDILNDDEALKKMAVACRMQGRPWAAYRAAELALKLAGVEKTVHIQAGKTEAELRMTA